jgi:hypothetical protein
MTISTSNIKLHCFNQVRGKLLESVVCEFTEEAELFNYLHEQIDMLLVKLALSDVFLIKHCQPSHSLSVKLSRLFNLQMWIKQIPDENVGLNLHHQFPQLFVDRPSVLCEMHPNSVRLVSGNALVKALPDYAMRELSMQRYTAEAVLVKRKWFKPFESTTWQTIFNTRKKSSVEQFCYSLGIDYHWKSGDLYLSKIISPIVSNTVNGETALINILSTNANDSIISDIKQAMSQHGETVTLADNEILLFHNQCYVHTYE